MSAYFIACFLVLFGMESLLNTNIPHWTTGAAALAAALALMIDKHWKP